MRGRTVVLSAILATLALTLLLLSLAVLGAAAERSSWWRWAVGGALLGATALARPETLLVGPPLLLWIVWQGRRDWRATLVAASCVAIGAGLAIAPCAIHNVRNGGGATLISSQGGLAFYQSNNPRARGFYTFLTEEGFTGSPAGQEDLSSAKLERFRKE